MGLGKDEFWWSILRFSWFGHQSRLDLTPTFVCMTGHLPALLSVFASMSVSDRVMRGWRGVYPMYAPAAITSNRIDWHDR
jgi:hypothetical protein